MISEISRQHAIRAWTRRHSGDWHETDETELQKWLAADGEHREAYEKVGRAWALAGKLTPSDVGVNAGATSFNGARTAPPPANAFASVLKRTMLAAGIGLLALTIGWPLYRSGYRWWNGTQIQLATQKGQPQSFSLEDGTTVMLDADSQLTANIGARRRSVSLDHGEALFNIKHEASRPFEVVTSAGRVQDLGTRFDIEALENSTQVSVLEGRVGVLTAKGQTLLVSGQAGGYDNAGNLLPPQPLKEDATRWSGGQRHFDREFLDHVLERVARYHAVKFVFSDSRLRELRVSGTFRIGDLPLFLRTLAAALPIEPRYLNPQQIEIAAATPAMPRTGMPSNGGSGTLH
ncbi:MAG TPA: FecR domain-containing protein [Steroidobacteraceae bacterium]